MLGLLSEKSGGDLLSQAVSDQVPSALEGLTSVFGMGTGVTPPQLPPKLCIIERPKRLDYVDLGNSTAFRPTSCTSLRIQQRTRAPSHLRDLTQLMS